MRTSRNGFVFAAALAAAGLAAPLAHAQLSQADLGKNLEYQQTGPATVVQYNGGVNAFLFARAFFTTPGAYDGGSVTDTSTLSSQGFNVAGNIGSPYVGYQTGYQTQAALDAAYPTGDTYHLAATDSTLANPDGLADVPYANDLYTADVPTLTAATFVGLQHINPAAATLIGFNSFTPNGLAGFGQGFLTIYDQTSALNVFNVAGFAPSTTSALVGAGVFTAGHTYTLELIFDDGVTGTDLANNVGYTARSDVRTLDFFTVPLAVPEPAAWAMLLVGFGLVGAVLRHRPARAAV